MRTGSCPTTASRVMPEAAQSQGKLHEVLISELSSPGMAPMPEPLSRKGATPESCIAVRIAPDCTCEASCQKALWREHQTPMRAIQVSSWLVGPASLPAPGGFKRVRHFDAFCLGVLPHIGMGEWILCRSRWRASTRHRALCL